VEADEAGTVYYEPPLQDVGELTSAVVRGGSSRAMYFLIAGRDCEVSVLATIPKGQQVTLEVRRGMLWWLGDDKTTVPDGQWHPGPMCDGPSDDSFKFNDNAHVWVTC